MVREMQCRLRQMSVDMASLLNVVQIRTHPSCCWLRGEPLGGTGLEPEPGVVVKPPLGPVAGPQRGLCLFCNGGELFSLALGLESLRVLYALLALLCVLGASRTVDSFQHLLGVARQIRIKIGVKTALKRQHVLLAKIWRKLWGFCRGFRISQWLARTEFFPNIQCVSKLIQTIWYKNK